MYDCNSFISSNNITNDIKFSAVGVYKYFFLTDTEDVLTHNTAIFIARMI